MDLGNRKHTVCALDQTGNVLWRKDVANTPEALKPFFEENAGATVAMETGLCCRWVSALAKSCGCDALVGNARKLAAIWQSKQKNDENDALLIAELARASRRLFHPVELRDDERHEMVQLIELREVAVSQRTQAVNSVRGLCKAHGVFIPKCDASCFHKVAADAIPDGMAWKFKPMLRHLKEVAATIKRYDAMLEEYAQKHFKEEVELLRTVPGVGPITSCAFVALIADPGRFGSARDAGAYFGLTPGQDKSGDKDAPKHITKTGSALMRHLLVTAANHILRASSPDTALKRHGERICARGGKVARRKAKTAVARKLAVVMLAMLKSGKAYDDGIAAVKAGAGESTVAA
jgi:transposase